VKTAVSVLPSADPEAPATLGDAAKVVAWGLAFWTGELFAAATFERSAMAMVAVQAALAEWGAGRMGIAWSDAGAPGRSGQGSAAQTARRDVGRRVAMGMALGGGTAVLSAVMALIVRAAVLVPGEAALGGLLVGLVVAALGAVRDELLLRGVVVRATRLLPPVATVAACGLVAAAARYGIDGRATDALVPEALRGVALGALWVRDRGAWMACAANAAWTWTAGSLLGGAWLDVRLAHDGARGGVVAVVIYGAAAGVASLWSLRPSRRPS
jgi:hypothetical protein